MKSKRSSTELDPELDRFLAADRAIPRIPEPQRTRLIASVVAASARSRRVSPLLAGRRISSLYALVGASILATGVVFASRAGWLGSGRPTSSVVAAAASRSGGRVPRSNAQPRASSPVSVPTLPSELDLPATPPSPAMRPPAAMPPSVGGRPNQGAGKLDDERVILEAARSSQQRGDYAQALQAITEHERRFAQGIFVEEREFLRISALGKLGRTAEAKARARSFVRSHPRSVFVSKLSPMLASP